MKIDILGVKVNKITQKEVIQRVEEWLSQKGGKYYIVTPNPEFVMAAQKDEEFRDILNKADIAIPDGVGLLWAAKFLSLKSKQKLKVFLQFIYTQLSLIFYPRYCRTVIPERVTGSDLIWKIARLSEQKNCSIYLLGAEEGVAQKAAEKLKEKYKNLKIAEAELGMKNTEFRIENPELVNRINRRQPDILLVAFGHPKQEKWIAGNLSKLENVKVAIGVGGAFDFIAGKAKRAPRILRKLGLEWLFRLFIEPWRAGRIFTATWKFSWAVLRHKLRA